VQIKLVKSDIGVNTLAPVSVGGHGPYPFVIDSGATNSAINSALAQQLHLPVSGPATDVIGENCTARVTPVAGPSWSVGNVALESQSLLSIPFPPAPGEVAPAGLLGSDVLRRFSAFQLDYQALSLGLPGQEGAPPTGPIVHGPTGVPIPQGLTPAHTSSSIPVLVAGPQLFVAVRIGNQGPYNFGLDTGSSSSSVDPKLVSTVGLRETGKTVPNTAVGCRQYVPQAESGPWSAGSVSLHPQPLNVVTVPGASGNILGTDVLRGFRVIVIGYSAGTLTLGSS
jgi:hypothetical protein